MEMRPEDYFVKWQDECFACLGSNDFGSDWILGDTFLRGFYSTHDHLNKRFGFAPHANSIKAAPYKAVVKDETVTLTPSMTTYPRPEPIEIKQDVDSKLSQYVFFAVLILAMILILVGVFTKDNNRRLRVTNKA